MRRQSQFCKLLVHRSPSGREVWLKCLRATAAFYGWDQAFVDLAPDETNFSSTGIRYKGYPNASPASRSGLRLRICRSRSKQGHPAGLTNCFRVSRSISTAQLAEIAAATTRPFAWMEDKSFARVSYDDWMRRAFAGFNIPD